jgi:hypothetical protein
MIDESRMPFPVFDPDIPDEEPWEDESERWWEDEDYEGNELIPPELRRILDLETPEPDEPDEPDYSWIATAKEDDELIDAGICPECGTELEVCLHARPVLDDEDADAPEPQRAL